MGIFYIAQIAVPLALLGWLILLPPPTKGPFLLLWTATGLWLAAIWLAGLWMLIPRWSVLVFGAGLVLSAWRVPRKKPVSESGNFQKAPGRRHRWIASGAGLLVGACAVAALGSAISARTPPPGPVVDLASPFDSDNYVVVNGGYSAITNGGHHMTLDQTNLRFRGYYGQSMAVDIARLNGWGRTTDGVHPSNPEVYETYRTPVMAPCGGTVVSARNDRPDMPVPQMDRSVMLGNHVILQCGKYHIVLAHLAQDSVMVVAGERVSTGQTLGLAGNSGNSSEPHLHLHAQLPGTPDNPISGAPVPITIDGRYLARNDRL